ncbi:MAG TPA: hypothetical protein VIL28_12095 [Steroidobacteraceae bacterium]
MRRRRRQARSAVVVQVELAAALIAHHRSPVQGWPDEEEETPQVSALPRVISA